MAGATTNYGFTKPDPGEDYDLDLLNNNFDGIDTAIKDRQNFSKMERSLPFTNTGFAWTGGASWDAGPLTVDASSGASSQMSSPQPAFAIPGTINGAIKIVEPGMYSVIWVVGPSAEPGTGAYRIITYGTWPGTPGTVDAIFGQDNHINASPYWESVVKATFRVPSANLEIRCVGVQANTTTNVARVRVVQLGKF